MATKLGKYYICDRCGTTSFFEKIGEGETDGSEKYDKLMQEFFDDWRDFDRRG